MMATQAATTPVHRGLAFLAGLGFAAVPSIGPFLALTVIAVGRIRLQKADRWWWLAAVLLGLPLAFTGAPLAALATVAQVLAAWLIFRSATEIRHGLAGHDVTNDVGYGLVAGLLIALLLGLRQFDGFAWETARTVLDAVTWQAHPAIFGHTMLVLAALFAIVVPSARLRVLALALGAVGVILSGAREAMFAWLFVAVGLRFVGRRGNALTKGAEWLLIGGMLVLALGLLKPLGLGRTGFLTAFVPGEQEANLFRGTEVVRGDWWYDLGVSVVGTNVLVDGVERAGLTVTKRWQEPWARLQQVLTLEPGQTYTLSAAWRPHGDARPGFEAWGESGNGPTKLSTYVLDGTHVANGTGGISVLTSSTSDLGDEWTRAQVTFSYGGESPLIWYVGVAPDRSNLTGVSTTFAELQLTASDTALPYVPGVAERGVGNLRESRLPIWRDAVAAITARPVLGWGESGLPRAMAALQPDEARLRPVAAHAHNMVLAVWVERGLLGVIGLLMLVTVLALRAVQQRDKAAAVVLGGVVILNIFDATLLSGAVIYPLAAILGWRAVGRRLPAEAETGVGSALLTRLGLAAGDYLSACVSLLTARFLLSQLGPEGFVAADALVLAYAAAAWPLAKLAFGQYPGYGRSSTEELKIEFLSTLAAGTALLGIRSVFGASFPVPWQLIVVATLIMIPLAPAIRSLTKRALAAFRVWGRPVLLVGSGGSADALLASLLDEPRLGLHPVMLVDDGGHSGGEGSRAVPRREALPADAAKLAPHVIVVPGARPSGTVERVLAGTGRHAFRIVQVVPQLGSIPTSDVAARPLGRDLSLELRNNLASGWNRGVKRTFDVFAVIIGGVLALPWMALIALAIRLESPGRVFFSQERIGRDGKPFNVWKFRTMLLDADERLRELLASDPEARAEWDANQKLADDPRVTRVGRFLRETSLDELPQLWNVVRGEMSFVGPRPIVEAEVSKYDDRFTYYQQVRPGITGIWQVSGRSTTSYEQRVDLDTYYVRNWSLWLDLDILIRTIGVVLRREGAY